MIFPVILCGGSGTRLWPLSRELYPKQFLALSSESTLLHTVLERTRTIEKAGPPILLCNEAHRFLVAEQLRESGVENAVILLEPMAKNTAPAAAIGALEALSQDANAVLLVMPADHVISNHEAFIEAAIGGLEAARAGKLVTFGIVPNAPETGFGYIKKGAPAGETAFQVDAFVEKPDPDTASAYVSSGEYFWNSGIFMFSAQRFLDELEAFAPDIVSHCRAAYEGLTADLDFKRLKTEAFALSPTDSIDYAVMEKTKDAVVVPLDASWSDIGSWSGLWEITDKDPHGNALRGDVVAEDTSGCYINASSRLVAAVGVSGHVVVETSDAVLVASMDRAQGIKAVVERLRREGRKEATVHSRVYRPWGSYETMDLGSRFQVKRIIVKPGATLSLQKHFHRAEHWIVVKGTALVTRGDEQITLCEDQSTYIPIGTLHRLHNPGRIPLELIEVQTGSYLGEDDIVRQDDIYGRVT